MMSPKQHFADRERLPGDRRGTWLSAHLETVAPGRVGADHAVAWAVDTGQDRKIEVEWVAGLDAARLSGGKRSTVQIWLGRPRSPGRFHDWPAFLPLLSGEERERLLQFRFAVDRWGFGAAHASLRHLLATRLGCAPTDLRLVIGEAGKPMLCPETHGATAASQLHFNLSHTRGLVAVALADCPVGIDVEPVRALADLAALARTHMGAEAQAALAACSDEAARTALFFHHWTLGEAFIKATGQGLGQGLATFAFTSHGQPCLTRITPGWGPTDRWQFGRIAGRAGPAS